MDDADYLDGFRFPNIGNHVRVKVPETIFPTEDFFVVLPNSGRDRQGLKSFLKFTTETKGGIRAVFSDVEKDLLEVAPGLRS